MRYADSVEEAAHDTEALLILTEWEEFGKPNLAKLHAILHYPIVIDGRNLCGPIDMADVDFTYLSVGRSSITAACERTADTV